MKKILAFVLTLAMMLTMLNVGFVVSAADEIPAGAIAISTPEQLANMQEGKYHYLTADIHLGTPGSLTEDIDGNPVQDDWAEPAEEADMITIPAGATLDGQGHTIYYDYYVTNPGWYGTNNEYVHALSWTHSMFELAAGDQITIKNVNFGDKKTPVYLSKTSAGNIGDTTTNDAPSIFDDTEGSNVVWENVDFYAERYGRGLDGTNIAVVVFKSLGNLTFNNCSIYTPYISAGSQAGLWIYNANKGSVTMNNCSNEGYEIYLGYTEKTDEETGDTIQVPYTVVPSVAGSYVAGYINYAYVNVTMTNCVNNLNISAHYNGTAGHWSGFVNNFQKGALYMENCVNNGDISVGGLTIGGAIVGRTGSAGGITSFKLINCVNNGNITRGTGVAGVTSNHGYGAITGHTASDGVYVVDGCVNTGNMTGATGCIGGIIGFAEGTATKEIKNCANYGNITSIANAEAGGIIGQLRLNGSIDNCKNFGAISAANYNGGIVGRAYGASTYLIKNCVNYGQIGNKTTKYAAGILSYSNDNACKVTIQNTTNYGSILSNQYSGGFVAENRNALTITNAKNFGEVAGVHAVGGFVGQSSNQTTTTATFTNCLNAGYIHQGPAAGEGIGGFFGRVAGVKAVIKLTNCANIGTITGSTKASAAHGAFGDTFGQFIGAYTVNAALNYSGTDVDTPELVGGFYDWTADGATKPTLARCYAFGIANFAEGAKSLKGWITAEYTTDADTGDQVITALKQDTFILNDVPVTEAPNNGVVGVNVEYTGTVKFASDLSAGTTVATIVNNIAGVAVVAGNTAQGDDAYVLAAPELRGYQQSIDGSDIRFLAGVFGSNFEEVGFTYSIEVNGDLVVENAKGTLSYVMKAINARGEDGAIESKTAADLGAKYISAITFKNLSDTSTYKITVAPTADNYAGASYTVTIVNGVVQ